MSTRSSTRKKPKPTLANRADKHILYEESVQCAEAEIDFIDNTFHKLRGRRARILREDFCGSANVSCEWVRRRSVNQSFGVDLDPEVLAWGGSAHVAKLTRAQKQRITLLNENVLQAQTSPVDIVLAMNFSYWVFKERHIMLDYFRRVYSTLASQGIFFLDAFGGFEAFQELEESTEYGRFTYIWDQASYNPINGHGTFKIHYKFRDGSKLRDAFVYHWRVWTLPELTEMLTEAGFKTTVYWEGTDKKNGGNGVFTPATEGEADAGWIVYIVAEK